MKATELRIGNWVKANGLYEGTEMQVDEIGSRGSMYEGIRVILFKDAHTGEFVKDCEGILLTEEWLLKFGFKKTGMVLRIDVTPHLEICSIAGEMRIQTINSGFTNTIPVQYVHQLQNLYFSLTGKELELRPTAA